MLVTSCAFFSRHCFFCGEPDDAAALAWTSSPYVRSMVNEIFTATERNTDLKHVTPCEERFVFRTKSMRFIESAPIMGRGIGSITEMFRLSAQGQSSARGKVSTSPHTQTVAVAIQLVLVTASVLWAMWISHVLLFRGGGLTAWIGSAAVVQQIIGSLFNSFPFAFREGWIYVVGAGVTAGMVLRARDTRAGAALGL